MGLKPETGTESTFRAKSVRDLTQPVQLALAEALDAGVGTFRLILQPGRYRDFALTLRGPVEPDGLHLVVEGAGERPVLLERFALNIRAGRITLRNLELRGYTGPGPVLQAHFGHDFVGEQLLVVGSRRLEESDTEPVVLLSSAGPRGVSGSAVLRDCWLLSNDGDGELALLATPRTGRAHLESLTLERCVFAGNRTAAALHPWFTRRVSISDTLIAEGRMGGAWLLLVSPLVQVEILRSVLATPGPLVEHRAGPDVAHEDFAPVRVSGSRLYLLEGVARGLALEECDLKPPLRLFADPAALAAAGRTGRPADPHALLPLLSP